VPRQHLLGPHRSRVDLHKLVLLLRVFDDPLRLYVYKREIKGSAAIILAANAKYIGLILHPLTIEAYGKGNIL
jgi:hypothetical protein